MMGSKLTSQGGRVICRSSLVFKRLAQLFSLLRWPILILTIALVALWMYTLTSKERSGPEHYPEQIVQSQRQQEKVRSFIPERQDKKDDTIGKLKIQKKTFFIHNNVLADTLKQGVGWLPSSVLPPAFGSCVIVGHNTQFRILKKIKLGEHIIFEKANGISYTFEVKSLDIWENINSMRFCTSQTSQLLLITCYPFYYVRDTPKKYVVTAELVG